MFAWLGADVAPEHCCHAGCGDYGGYQQQSGSNRSTCVRVGGRGRAGFCLGLPATGCLGDEVEGARDGVAVSRGYAPCHGVVSGWGVGG
jgi:hypothetical protein